MLQILQNIRNGDTILAEVPAPGVRPGALLIESEVSLVSIGTEKMLIEFGKANWFQKARQQPDKVRQVLRKIQTDGLATTLKAVNAKLDHLIPLGYSNVGRVLEVGSGVTGYIPGDLVLSNGPHAGIVCVGQNLCAKVPETVSSVEASFTVVGSIALQGIRLIRPGLGENIVVTGLGLIGLLAVQILQAHGCRVLGIDVDSEKCRLAESYGATTCDLSKGQDPLAIADDWTNGQGVDAVLITASTKSNDPVHHGAQMCRKRGRIVLVGVTGLELSRDDFYEKELSFQVSCSYGPGRYDPAYEEEGNDYPLAFVRWTEQRNFTAFLDLLSRKLVDVASLVSKEFPIKEALTAYGQVASSETLGVIIRHLEKGLPSGPDSIVERTSQSRLVSLSGSRGLKASSVVVGVVGAGGFCRQVLLPTLSKSEVRLRCIVSSKGVSGTALGDKFGFELSATDDNEVILDDEINLVIVATRHDSHADLVKRSLLAGKRVFVEKPLCLNAQQLAEIEQVYQQIELDGGRPFLMVGFNRRFAPHIRKTKELLSALSGPAAINIVVNAGFIPADHWTQDMKLGGGRIVGEACHFIDLARFLAGSSIKSVKRLVCGEGDETGPKDSVCILIGFENGYTSSILYLANGNQKVPKERIEVFCSGRVILIDNFRKMTGHGFKQFSKSNLWRQDKGHSTELELLVSAARQSEPAPIPFTEIVEVTKASFVAAGLEAETPA